MNRLYKILFVILLSILFINVNAASDACSQKNAASFGATKCDTKVWGNMFTSYSCANVGITKGYEAKDKNGNTAFIACYKCDNNTDCSGSGGGQGYYIQSYIYNSSSGKCELTLNDFIAFDAGNSARRAFTHKGWDNSESGGCPKYIGMNSSNNKVVVSNDSSDVSTSKVSSGSTTVDNGGNGGGSSISTPSLDLSDSQMSCSDLLGPNLTKVVHAGINVIQIAGAIIAILNGMVTLIPAVMSKDADGLKKASKKLVSMAVILAVIFLLPSLLRIIGDLLGFDISCIV